VRVRSSSCVVVVGIDKMAPSIGNGNGTLSSQVHTLQNKQCEPKRDKYYENRVGNKQQKAENDI